MVLFNRKVRKESVSLVLRKGRKLTFRSANFAVKKEFLKQISAVLLFSLFIVNNHPTYGQETKEPLVIDDIAEELAADENDPDAASVFIEYLSELTENPVRINSADENELSRLFFLSEFQVKSLAEYVKNTGKLVSVNEIPSVAGFDRHTAEIMIPFISLDDSEPSASGPLSVHSTLISNLIIKPGERDTALLGSGIKSLTKVRINAGRFSSGLTVEKDAGESFFNGSPPLPDFLSGYSSYSGKGMIKEVIAGDFSLHLGEGTCINTSMPSGIRLTQPGLVSGKDDLRPYSSTDENNFLRGVAAELSLSNSNLIIFLSLNRVDATLKNGEDSSKTFISSLYTSGLHANPASLLKKDNVTETIWGLGYSYSRNNVRAGINWSETRFSLPFSHESGDPASIYSFEGRMNRLISANYTALVWKILLFGEASLNNKTCHAVIQGATIRASDRLTVNLLYDYYSPGYTAFNGRGPGTGSSTGNEEGLTGNFCFEAAKNLFILAGTNFTRYPWLRYRCSFPSTSARHEVLARYLPSGKINLEASYGFRNAIYNDGRATGVAGIENSVGHTFKMLFRYSSSERLIFTTRVGLCSALPSRSKGGMIMQDINYTFTGIPVTFWFRYSLFSTDSWDSRLYAYENDLLYNFSIPALYGEGSRSYLMAKVELSRWAELRIKYGITNLKVPGAGRIESDELKFQLRAWF